MTDIERYRVGADQCAAKATDVVTKEVREIWLTIERSYRFLLDREERIARASTRCEAGAR